MYSEKLSPTEVIALDARIAAVRGVFAALPRSLSNGETILPACWRALVSVDYFDTPIRNAVEKGRRKANAFQFGDAQLEVPADARFADEMFRGLGAHVTLENGEKIELNSGTIAGIVTGAGLPRFQRAEFDQEHYDGSALTFSPEYPGPRLLIAETRIDGVQLTGNGAAVSCPHLGLEFSPELLIRVRD